MQLFVVFFPRVRLSAYCALLFPKQHSQYSYHEVYHKSDTVKQEPNKTGFPIKGLSAFVRKTVLCCMKQEYWYQALYKHIRIR